MKESVGKSVEESGTSGEENLHQNGQKRACPSFRSPHANGSLILGKSWEKIKTKLAVLLNN